jgi:phage gp36-like protein
MAYITQEILYNFIDQKEVVLLTDDNNDGQIDESVLNKAFESADGEIDLYLKDVYQDIPQPTTSKILQSIAADLTIYHLHKRRMRTEMPESITEIYTRAIKRLEDIRAGKISLDINRKDPEFNIKSNKKADDRVFPKKLLDLL